jgi:hypothetical protein
LGEQTQRAERQLNAGWVMGPPDHCFVFVSEDRACPKQIGDH